MPGLPAELRTKPPRRNAKSSDDIVID